MRIDSYAWLDANAAWALLAAGLLLIYWELCRPGSVLPGTLGGVCALVAVARFAAANPAPVPLQALGLFAAGWIALGSEAWLRWPGPSGLLGAALLTSAAMCTAVRWFVALPCAVAVSYATVVLGSAALQAYLAKRI